MAQVKPMPTVLIVDDEKLFLSSVSEGIANILDGIRILTAGHGAEALDIVRQGGVDLVVTDLKMPVMDGFQLLARMASEHPQIPAIVMTAFGTSEIERRVREIGAIGYIEKPIDLHALASLIENILARRSAGFLRGINLASFLQLLSIERKTCTLNIRHGQQLATLIFQEGELVNARTEHREGEAAVYEVIGWSRPEIEMSGVVKKQPVNVHIPLDHLLPNAHQILDEQVLEQFLSPEGQTSGPPVEPFQPTGPRAEHPSQENTTMANIKESLVAAMEIEGTIGAALADWKSGMCLGTIGGTPTFNLEVAAAGSTEVIRSELKLMSNIGLKEVIEDILITLDTQYHLIRLLKTAPTLALYLVIKKDVGNLALARHKLAQIEAKLEV